MIQQLSMERTKACWEKTDMIFTRKDLHEYLNADAKANARTSSKPRLFGDEIWKYIVLLRKTEYYTNRKAMLPKSVSPMRIFCKFRLHRMGMKLGYSIPINVIGKGLSLVHQGTIVIAGGARIGENCRIHEGVTVGATNGSDKAAVIGNNVFIASGAKIIGDVSIADDVAIAANAVVVKSITEKGTTWGGVPAVKISSNDSHSNLSKLLFG